MLRAFFQGFPQELEDSASLDGCSRFQFYWRILLPLSKPSLMALGIFVFMGTWNEFFQALLLINEDSKRTLPLGLTAFQDGITSPTLRCPSPASILRRCRSSSFTSCFSAI